MSACIMCGKLRDPAQEADSHWGVVEMQGKSYPVCPQHLPSLLASTEQRRQAYIAVFKRILEVEGTRPI
jgi:hypothetical protein